MIEGSILIQQHPDPPRHGESGGDLVQVLFQSFLLKCDVKIIRRIKHASCVPISQGVALFRSP
jgi:hypothetical protein